MPRAPRRARDDHRARRRAPGRSSSRSRWAAPPTSPTCCCSRKICSSCFPLLAQLKARCDEAGVALWPGNNIGYFGPYESVLRGGMPRRPHGLVRRRLHDARHRGQRRHQGLPVAARPSWTGRQHPRRLRCRTSGSGRRRCATCAIAPSTTCGATAAPATTPTSAAPAAPGPAFSLFGKPGNNPLCHHRALEMRRQGKRERLVQVAAPARRPVRSRQVRDHRRGDLPMSHLLPALPATATSTSTRPPVRSARPRSPRRSARQQPPARRRARLSRAALDGGRRRR